MIERIKRVETIYESCIALLDATVHGRSNLNGLSSSTLRELMYPQIDNAKAMSIAASALEISRDDTLSTHRDSVEQVLIALRDESLMRPHTLPQSNVGLMFTEVLSRSMHNGWTRDDYVQARATFEQTHKPDEKMKVLLDHGFNIAQMIYTSRYPRTEAIFHDLTTSLSEIKAGL